MRQRRYMEARGPLTEALLHRCAVGLGPPDRRGPEYGTMRRGGSRPRPRRPRPLVTGFQLFAGACPVDRPRLTPESQASLTASYELRRPCGPPGIVRSCPLGGCCPSGQCTPPNSCAGGAPIWALFRTWGLTRTIGLTTLVVEYQPHHREVGETPAIGTPGEQALCLESLDS